MIGALAWLLQTRMDIATYVCSLQRVAKAPLKIHLKRANRLVRYVQRKPVSLICRALKLPVRLVCVGDSAYQSQEEGDPLVMRGMIFFLAHCEEQVGGIKHYSLQLIDWLSSKQKQVVRGVWTAELYNQIGMVEFMIVLVSFFEEVRFGIIPAERLLGMRSNGGFALQTECYVDNMGVYKAAAADHIKLPTEKGTLFHLQFLRECIDSGLVSSWRWCDTRDMLADGMTKGSVDRDVLHKAMNGHWHMKHPVLTFQGERKKQEEG